jgi:hypothetical protein
LNNRKAKLARIAKERGQFEGDNADKPSTPATLHLGESSESAREDNYLPPARVMNALSKGRLVSPDSNEQTVVHMVHLTSSLSCAWNFIKLLKIEVIMLIMISPHCSSHGSSYFYSFL